MSPRSTENRCRNLESPPYGSTGGRVANPVLRRASSLALAFVVLCLLVAFDVTRAVDWWGLSLALPLVSYPLDVVASVVTFLGAASVTGTIALDGELCHGLHSRLPQRARGE